MNWIEFGPFRLDLAAEQLLEAETVRPLQPRAFALLRYLVERLRRVVSNEEQEDRQARSRARLGSLLRGGVPASCRCGRSSRLPSGCSRRGCWHFVRGRLENDGCELPGD